MTPLKETLDVGEAPAAQGTNRTKPESGQLRSDAVSLDVPVKVHGSRVVEVVRGTTSHTEPFEEQTSTMIVFPLGGVLKMSTQVGVGQAIVLTNLKTRQDAICRVVKTRTNPNLHSYVEVEFSHPQPGYWGVRFPSDAPEPMQKAASPAAAAPAASAPMAPAISAPAPKVETAKPESAITEHKESKVAAPAPVPARIEKPVPTVAPPAASLIDAAPVDAPAASFSLEQLRGDAGAAPSAPPASERAKSAETHLTEARPEAESSAAHEMPVAHEASTSTFGRFAASSASGGENAPARPAFGASLEYGSLGSASEKSPAQSRNGALIAACVALLLVAAGGGGYYFLHLRPSAQHTATAAPVSQPSPAPASPMASQVAPSAAPAEQAPAVAAPSATPAKNPIASAPAEPRTRQPEVNEPAASKPAQSPFQTRASEPEKQKPAQAVPDMFGALNAHPTRAVRTGGTEGGAAPSIDSSALAGGQGIALPSTEPSPANLAPPPQPAQEAPVRVGGDVKPPQLISSPPVMYPEIAHQAGIEGDVVVRIVIDKTGKVTEAKAITGPMLLRDAAITALRGRKYVPSKLDGRPISIEMLVTIQFHR